MAEAISNTSPLFYLHQIGVIDWLPHLFSEVWIPLAVLQELATGKRQGCNVPEFGARPWIRIVDPQRVLLEGKKLGLASELAPLVDNLESAGMWISADIRRRILTLAGEAAT